MFGLFPTSATHVKGSSKTLPKHESKQLSEHKVYINALFMSLYESHLSLSLVIFFSEQFDIRLMLSLCIFIERRQVCKI